MSRCSRRSIAGRERRPWERGGRWEGGRGCRTIRSPTSTSVGRRGPSCVCFVAVAHKIVYVSQQTRKVADRVSVICPNNRKGLTFVGRDAVGWDHARHGRQNALILALDLTRCPDTLFIGSNLYVEESGVFMRSISRLHRLQPGLVSRI